MMNKIKILAKNDSKTRYWLFYSEINRFWWTNFQASQGIIIFDSHTKNNIYFLDDRYIEEAKKTLKTIELRNIKQFKSFWSKLENTINIESDLPAQLFLKLQKMNAKIKFKFFNFDQLRMIKTVSEIEKIKQISKITAQIWKKINNQLANFKNENEIAFFIQKQFLEANATISFNPIVASDIRTAYIHTTPTENKIKNVLLCDFGGKYQNYCSDFTRTIVLNQKSKLFEIEKKIQIIYHKIIKLIKPGVKISQIVKHCDELFANEKWKLQHALGHGIGIKVHEEPFLSVKNDFKLQANMVIAIEPGVYFPNLGGIRYEDTILITENGCEILTV